jgi:hypothetical protein
MIYFYYFGSFRKRQPTIEGYQRELENPGRPEATCRWIGLCGKPCALLAVVWPEAKPAAAAAATAKTTRVCR